MARIPMRIGLCFLASVVALTRPVDPGMEVLAQGRQVALVGATLIDGTGSTPIADATLVLENGRVKAAGPSARVKVPKGAERVDLAGKVIIPGLIGGHNHVKIQLPAPSADFTKRWVDE